MDLKKLQMVGITIINIISPGTNWRFTRSILADALTEVRVILFILYFFFQRKKSFYVLKYCASQPNNGVVFQPQ